MSSTRRASGVKAVAAEFLQHLEDVKFTGWLKKECDNKIRRDYSKKYGIIYKDQLYLYENDKGAKATHIYDTEDIRIECKRENEQWGFTIEILDDKYRGRKITQFLVNSEHEMLNWVNHLNSGKYKSIPEQSVRYVTLQADKRPSPPKNIDIPEDEHYQTPKPNMTLPLPTANSDFLPHTAHPDHEHYIAPKPRVNSPITKFDSLPNTPRLDPQFSGKSRSSTLPLSSAAPVPPRRPHRPSPKCETRSTISPGQQQTKMAEEVKIPRPIPRPRSLLYGKQEESTNKYEISYTTSTEDTQQDKEDTDETDTYVSMQNLKVIENDVRNSRPSSFTEEEEESVTEESNYEEIDNIIGPVDDKDKHILPPSVFQLNFDRNKTEKLLLEDGTPGVYIIRKKTGGTYVLSAFLLGSARHYIIYQENDQLFLKKGDEPQFSKLSDLIRNYMRFNLPTCHARLEQPFSGV